MEIHSEIDNKKDWDGWGITCQCGHYAPFEYFECYDSPESNPHYQCQKCGIEWNINDYRTEQKEDDLWTTQ